MVKLTEKLPKLYHNFLPDFIFEKSPSEKVATCGNCPQTFAKNSTSINTKCCIYYAQLPNYLIGGLLSDKINQLDFGKASAMSIIESRLGVSPYGFRKPIWYRQLYNATRPENGHKRTQSEKEILRCPFYDEEGHCSIWPYREHGCSTFFCFSVGGSSGQNFWNHLNKYLKTTERKLAQYAAKQLSCTFSFADNWSGEESQGADDATKNINEKRYKQLWSGWQGTEKAFYIASFELIKNLSKKEYQNIMGDEWTIETNKASSFLTGFNDAEFPNFLLWNKHAQLKVLGKKVEVNYNDKTVSVPMNKFLLLQSLDGTKSLQEITHAGFRLQMGMASEIEALIDLGVLTKA